MQVHLQETPAQERSRLLQRLKMRTSDQCARTIEASGIQEGLQKMVWLVSTSLMENARNSMPNVLADSGHKKSAGSKTDDVEIGTAELSISSDTTTGHDIKYNRAKRTGRLQRIRARFTRGPHWASVQKHASTATRAAPSSIRANDKAVTVAAMQHTFRWPFELDDLIWSYVRHRSSFRRWKLRTLKLQESAMHGR